MPAVRSAVPTVWSVVVAGGSGTRFGRMKQFAELAGRPVVAWAVSACRAVSAGVVLVIPEHADPGEHAGHGADQVVCGGPSRSESVRRGLAAVPDEAGIVVVHDAARPLAERELFESVIGALADGAAAGAICALAVSDTLKRVDQPIEGEGVSWVTETVDRRALVAVQTPQAFRAAALRQAHASRSEATDDAALVEGLGLSVRVVPGSPRNLKLTTAGDLAYAEHLLKE